MRALGGLVLAATAGCVGESPTPPSVLLVSVDTLRPDRLGCYGAAQVETPAIDALARSGVRFENAYTPAPLTLPAHWTLHTGVEPWRHGVVDNGMVLAEPPVATLAERFAAADYDTAAFVAAFVLHRTFGLDRGFAEYDDGPAADAALDQVLHATAPANERVDRALAWLRRPRSKPFFLWLHLFDPHAPYLPPPELRARYAGRPYDGEVAFVDTQVARVLAALDRAATAQNTIVLLLSDHGESLGEHGEQTHGVLLYDATLRVPLIVRWPDGLRAGEVRRDAVTLADVAPTLLALARLDATPGVDGHDLFGSSGAPPRRLGAISESPRRRLGWASQVAIRDGDWKYIAAPRPELFRLAEDRNEVHDRLRSDPERAADLALGARAIEIEMRNSLEGGKVAAADSEALARIQALGYVGGRGSSIVRARSLPDPKDEIASLGRFDRAYQQLAEGRLDEAEAGLRELLRSMAVPPQAALEGLARIAQIRGHGQEAEAFYRLQLQSDPEAITAIAQLVILTGRRNDPRAAVEWGRRLTALAPRDAGASRLLAEALRADGDVAGSEVEWRRGLAMAPRSGWLRLGYARFLLRLGRGLEAGRELERLLADESLPADVRGEARALLAGH